MYMGSGGLKVREVGLGLVADSILCPEGSSRWEKLKSSTYPLPQYCRGCAIEQDT